MDTFAILPSEFQISNENSQMLLFLDENRVIVKTYNQKGSNNPYCAIYNLKSKTIDTISTENVYISNYNCFLNSINGNVYVATDRGVFNLETKTSVENEINKLDNEFIYPNPSKESFSIPLNCNDLKIEVKIVSSSGEIVLNNLYENNIKENLKIDCSKWVSGVYLIQAICNNLTKNYKVIIE